MGRGRKKLDPHEILTLITYKQCTKAATVDGMTSSYCIRAARNLTPRHVASLRLGARGGGRGWDRRAL
jgi:hypothetical protein